MPRKKSRRTSSSPTARAKPLRTSGAYVRKNVPATDLPGVEVMGRAMTAFAELPIRLMKCTSPIQIWGEYLRFGQLLFSCLTSLPVSGVSHGEERFHPGGPSSKRRSHRARNPYRATRDI
jgi:hypothetical protein